MKAFARILLMLCACTIVYAQDDQLDEFTIEDVPTDDVATPYFGVGGGFVASFNFIKTDEINKLIDNPGMLPGKKLDAPLVMLGAQGFAAIPFIPNARIGFLSVGGSLMTDGEVTESLGTFKRQVEFSASLNAITLDYAFVPFRGLALLPGAMVGWGTMTLRASQSAGERSMGDGEFNFNQSSTNRYREISTSHFTLTPNLNIEYAITQFAMIRANAGYNIALGASGTWDVDNGVATVDGVSEDIHLGGLSAQVGLFIGLFNH